MDTTFAIRHFPDRKKPCLVLEQGNQCIVIGTIRNAECEHLLREYFGGTCGIWGDMRDLFEPQETETWNGIHAPQITVPKGTFERIFNDADDENDI